MLQSIPSEAAFAAHGLYDVVLDLPPNIPPYVSHSLNYGGHTSSHTTSNRISGWAKFRPVPTYPPFPSSKSSYEDVRFYLGQAGDPSSLSMFRRQAQLIALDTVSLPWSTPGSSSSTSIDPPPDASPPRRRESNTSIDTHKRYGLDREVLAWWEDEHGLWLLTLMDREPTQDLVEVWGGIIGRGDVHHQVRELVNGETKTSPKGKMRSTGMEAYAEACEVLLKVVDCLTVLHGKRLSLIACRPHTFTLRQGEPSTAAAIRLTDIAPLPGFSLAPLLAGTPLATSSLFLRDPIDASANPLTDAFIRRNLRYLSPGAASGRRVSTVGDIYSFGVLAYELLTGSAIDGGPESPDEADVDLLADIHRHITSEIVPPIVYLQREAAFGAVTAELPPQQLSDIVMKCLAKDLDERYATLDALAYDLRKLAQICRVGGDLSRFVVAEVDDLARFHLPRRPVYRDTELSALDQAFAGVASAPTITSEDERPPPTPVYATRVLTVWGLSGSGKSQIVTGWLSDLEAADGGSRCFVGYSKLDEHMQKPLASFVQIFESLLDRVLTDPKEDPKEWNKKIRYALGHQFSVFHSLLSSDVRKLVTLGTQAPPIEAIDWANFVPAFKMWSKRLLQLFATRQRPLVLLVDDIHWMAEEEVRIWRALLDGPQPLNHVLVLSLYRVEVPEPPPPHALLSATAASLVIRRLPEAGVAALTKACFKTSVDNVMTLASLLYAETGGSPLYLRSMLATLVKEGVIFFDFDYLLWRFDPLALQMHMSDVGVDAYLEKVQKALPEDVRELLSALACLPSTGFDIDLLAELLGKTRTVTDSLIHTAAAIGAVVTFGAKSVRFAHDRQRTAAYRLLSKEDLGQLHLRVSNFLRKAPLRETFVFDAADHALAARSLGVRLVDNNATVSLLLDAVSRSALSASFAAAKRHLDAADDIIKASGGDVVWMQEHRSTYLSFLQLHTQVCGVLKLHEESFAKLRAVSPLCTTAPDRLRVGTLVMRQLVSANRHIEAMKLLWDLLDENGFNPRNPTGVSLISLRTPDEVEELGRSLTDEPMDENDTRVLVSAMLCFAGPTIFVSELDRRADAFRLGISLVSSLGKFHETTSYLVAGAAITQSEIKTRQALWRLAKRLAALRPTSFLTSSALVVIGALSHAFLPLEEVADDMDPAFEMTAANGNFELASYVMSLDLAARRFSNRPHDIQLVLDRYNVLRPFIAPPIKVLLNAPIQYAQRLLEYATDGSKPWALEGALLSKADVEMVSALSMHVALYQTLALRLAILYDAPLAEQQSLVSAGARLALSMVNTVYGAEWAFLSTVVAVQSDYPEAEYASAMAELETLSSSPDYVLRLEFLRVLRLLHSVKLEAIAEIEEFIEKLDNLKQYNLSALLNLFVGKTVIVVTKHKKMASGYIRAAAIAYRQAESIGPCHMLRERYPGMAPTPPPCVRLPLDGLESGSHPPVAPTLRRASVSQSNETVTSENTSHSRSRDEALSHTTDDSLDTLTLMRSSLALASEQNPPILLCTLLRILCQFVRADYAAIGLCDDTDKTNLRLRAAGSYGRILPYDLSIGDQAAQAVCPAIVMLHVARTGNPIIKPTGQPRMRADPYYGGRTPRTLICLPINNQGTQAGVILLSSMTTASSQAQSASAREVISCLATFATIVTSNYSFTHRLKLEVDQRTQELTNALQAKTQFLSQCSHELRSPLSAVLGLAAVLEASPGLSEVQREHLRTIISSGEDLLGLINNILDHSRLESHSVTLERIPFNLRDVVEGALDTIAAVAQKKNVEVCLISSFKTDPPGMLGDPFRIKQVLLNLLSNAVKFTPKGRVTVQWRHEPVPDDKVKVSLDVEDTGIGIPAQKMDKLFRSFSQIDESITRSFGGSGLGLIISKDLAKLLGGDCTAVSEYGKGSKFTFSFVAESTSDAPFKYNAFPSPKSVFVICPAGPWWEILEENLTALNCKPVRFHDDATDSLVLDHPHGLNSSKDYGFVFVDTTMIDKEIKEKMQKLQPKAKFIFLVRSIDLARAMRDFDITRESIVARPIKFASLYNALMAEESNDTGKIQTRPTTTKVKKAINKELAKKQPLDILIVDDNVVNVTVGRRILEMFGYMDVASALDGQQAIEAAEKKQYDLILLDLQMPVLDGFSAHKRIQASPLAGDPCVVALTANADQATQKQCAEAGFFDYLSKPLDIPRLESILHNVFEHRLSHRTLKHGSDTQH